MITSNSSLLSLSILNSYNDIFIIHIYFILQDQFELEGDSNLLTKTINTKCGRLLSSGFNELYQTYKKLVQSHGADYAKSHPPKNATLEQRTGLIEAKLTNKE